MAFPYGATILDHFRRPRNQRSLASPTASHEGFNPLCGDRVRLEVEIDGVTIRDAAFTANACAICTASASLLTERVTGIPVNAALRITDSDVLSALGDDLPVGRVECAILPARAMRGALSRLPAAT